MQHSPVQGMKTIRPVLPAWAMSVSNLSARSGKDSGLGNANWITWAFDCEIKGLA